MGISSTQNILGRLNPNNKTSAPQTNAAAEVVATGEAVKEEKEIEELKPNVSMAEALKASLTPAKSAPIPKS